MEMSSNAFMGEVDVYLYGMTVYSTVHILHGDYPEADSYAEIKQTYLIPGGETGNSAIVLSQCGLNVKIDGPYLGTKTKEGILHYCRRFGIDCTGMVYDQEFDGVSDMVIVDSSTRTVFGRFGGYFREGKRWSNFDKNAAMASKVVSIDPFFGEISKNLAIFCHQVKKPYVTIDCEPDSDLHRYASATVISNEFIRNSFKETDIDELFSRYTEAGDGLVIFTFGSRDIIFGRKGGSVQKFTPYRVNAVGTLGAGDTFRGGVVYGILKGLSDTDTVRFAAATAACVCRRFPMVLDPPCIEEIKELAGL